ncbi:MAG: hypothetical protein IJW70_08110 [Clostridia bacterium]|nr:hypothetical protein [Clostridia bacterium]
MKKVFSLSAVLLALALEIMPYGAVCNFMTPPDEPPLRLTYSYFSLVPFGYANFAPFIVAILSCALLVLVAIYVFVGQRMRVPVLTVAAVASLLSLAPLLLGISYYSLVGLLITLCLIITTVLVLLDRERMER